MTKMLFRWVKRDAGFFKRRKKTSPLFHSIVACLSNSSKLQVYYTWPKPN